MVAIDARAAGPGRWEVYTHGGRKARGLDAVEWARTMAARGAGEILLTSMDRDGTRSGFDLALTRAELEGITAPVLLVHGAQDRVVPLRDSFLPLLEALPDVRGHVFGSCGHASPLERTDEFNPLITSFLETDR